MYTIYWSAVIGTKTVKLELRGFKQGKAEFYISGTEYENLKGCDDADSADSFSDSEAQDCTIKFARQSGHIAINRNIIMENEDMRVLTETQFSQEVEETLRTDFAQSIELVRVQSTSDVLSQIIKLIACYNKNPEHQQLETFVLASLVGVDTVV